jgi:hypothetical protein
MDVSVCDAEVRALAVRAGETLGIYPFGSTAPTFDLTPGAYRKRRRFHIRREGAGEAAGRTIKWSTWLEQTLDFGVDGSYSRVGRFMMEPVQVPKPRKAEHEEEQEYMKGHMDPPA